MKDDMREMTVMTPLHPVFDVFAGHRTTRRFTGDPIPPEHLDAIIEAGRRAPTDASAQMGTFIRITDPDLRLRLSKLAGDQRHIVDGAEFFVICMDTHRLRRLVEHRGGEYGMGPLNSLLFGVTDAVLVAQNMVIAAEALGYATCYIGGVQNNADKIATELNMPPGTLPVVGLVLGAPAPGEADKPKRPRIPRQAVFMENSYREMTSDLLDACYQAMASYHRSGDWYNALNRYFTAEGSMPRRERVLRRALAQQGLAPEERGS
jgi:FMN reductase (NADPH)